jgi:putative copper export protein
MNADGWRALLAWPLVASVVATFGTAGFVLLSADDQLFDVRAAAGELLSLWRLLTAVLLVVLPLLLLDITADMAGVSWISAVKLAPQVLTETHAGRIFEWYLPVVLTMFLVARLPLPQFITSVMLFILTGISLLLQALMSHAIDKGNLAVAVYSLHEIAAGLWIGGLLTFWRVTSGGNPPDAWVAQTARRVSMFAFWSVIVLLITGSYVAYTELGFDLYHVLFSAYGRTLFAKVVVFVGVLAIGAYNRYWLVPHVSERTARAALLRNVGIESIVLLFAAVGLASLLANTPPAHGMHHNMAHFSQQSGKLMASRKCNFAHATSKTNLPCSDRTGFNCRPRAADATQVIKFRGPS